MARGPTPPRLIPNYAMTAPWSDPESNTSDAQEGLAQVALLSGATIDERSIVAVLQSFTVDQAIALGQQTGR